MLRRQKLSTQCQKNQRPSSAQVFSRRFSFSGSTPSSGSASNVRWRTKICGAWSRKIQVRKFRRVSLSIGTDPSQNQHKMSQRQESHQQLTPSHRPASTSAIQRQRNRRAFCRRWLKLSVELSCSDHAWNSFKMYWHLHHLKYLNWSSTLWAVTNRHGAVTSTRVFFSALHQLKRCSSLNISIGCSSSDFALELRSFLRFSAKLWLCQTQLERNQRSVKLSIWWVSNSAIRNR